MLSSTVDLSNWICLIASAWCLASIEASSKNLILWKIKITSKAYQFLAFGISLSILVGIGLLLPEKTVEIPALPLIFGCSICIFVCWIVRYKKYGSIRKPKREYQVTFSDLFREALGEKNPVELLGVANAFIEDFEKINQKRLKKGKEPITEEEYMDIVYKRGETSEKLNWIACVGFGVFLVAVCVQEALTGTFTDTIIFTVLVLFIAFLIWKFVYGKKSFLRKAENTRKELLSICKKKGITIMDYVKMEKEKE